MSHTKIFYSVAFSYHLSLGVTDAASNSLIPKLSEGRVYVQVSCGYSHCCGLDDEGEKQWQVLFFLNSWAKI